jgi:hypothetical protein
VESAGFVGRAVELARLETLLSRVGDARRDLPGVAVLLRGRRRVGKSRLVEVFCERAGVPSVYFQASQGADPAAERAALAAAVLDSDLPGRELFAAGMVFPTWMAAFRQLTAALPADAPSIVVIDELPWLLEADPALEGALQTAWDQALARKPVLLILIGSDLAEPMIREALLRVAPELGWPGVEAVGGWWNRQNNPEIDLVGADRDGVANRILFAGSIKWQDAKPFDRHDYAALVRDMTAVPGVDPATSQLAASRNGVAAGVPIQSVSPDELMAAWQI